MMLRIIKKTEPVPEGWNVKEDAWAGEDSLVISRPLTVQEFMTRDAVEARQAALSSKQSRMSEIQINLAVLDIKRNKLIDGEITAAEWNEARSQILSLRNEYNALELDLGLITQEEYDRKTAARAAAQTEII